MSEAGLLSERPTTGLKFDKKLSDTERSSRVIISEKSPSTIGTHYRLSTLKEVNKHDPFDTGFDSFSMNTGRFGPVHTITKNQHIPESTLNTKKH